MHAKLTSMLDWLVIITDRPIVRNKKEAMTSIPKIDRMNKVF